jgi:exonuclease VII large subunit
MEVTWSFFFGGIGAASALISSSLWINSRLFASKEQLEEAKANIGKHHDEQSRLHTERMDREAREHREAIAAVDNMLRREFSDRIERSQQGIMNELRRLFSAVEKLKIGNAVMKEKVGSMTDDDSEVDA